MLSREKAVYFWYALQDSSNDDEFMTMTRAFSDKREIFYDYILWCINNLPSENSCEWEHCPVCGEEYHDVVPQE